MTYAIAYRGREWWLGQLRFDTETQAVAYMAETKERERKNGLTHIQMRVEEIVPDGLGRHGPPPKRRGLRRAPV